MERRIPIRRHSQLRGKCRMLQTLGAYMTRLCGALFYGKADSDPPPSACRDSATRSRVVGFGGHLFVPQWKPSGLLFARDEAGAADWNPPFHSNDRASCGAPAKMERELHGFLLYRAIYGAAAPPWRGRHGAQFAAPLGWAVAADWNPPFHRLRSRLGSVHDRVPWRPILWRGGFRSAAIGLLGWCNPFLGCGVWRASFCPSVASRLGVNHSGSPPGYFLCDQTVAADRNPPFHRLRGSQLYGLESAFP